MRKEYLAILFFVKFGYNYSRPEEFINYICEKTGRNYLKEHLTQKFNEYYNTYGSMGVMNRFFVEIDEELQQALVDYAINIYAPNGMFTKIEEYKSL